VEDGLLSEGGEVSGGAHALMRIREPERKRRRLRFFTIFHPYYSYYFVFYTQFSAQLHYWTAGLPDCRPTPKLTKPLRRGAI
jgi:hypothetical protein